MEESKFSLNLEHLARELSSVNHFGVPKGDGCENGENRIISS